MFTQTQNNNCSLTLFISQVKKSRRGFIFTDPKQHWGMWHFFVSLFLLSGKVKIFEIKKNKNIELTKILTVHWTILWLFEHITVLRINNKYKLLQNSQNTVKKHFYNVHLPHIQHQMQRKKTKNKIKWRTETGFIFATIQHCLSSDVYT